MSYPVVPEVPTGNITVSNEIAGHVGTTQYLEPNADGSLPAVLTGEYPEGATPINATSGKVAAAEAAATLAAAAGKTTYITGFEVTATGATSATVVLVTVSDGTWTLTYVLNVPATSAATQLEPLIVRYAPALPASAVNTTIVVTCPTLGTGNTNACVNAQGYRL